MTNERIGPVQASRSDDAAADMVNHPPHYSKHQSGIECIEVTRWMGFNLGNAMKYIWRADEKDDAIQDLSKAIWYINDEIKKRRKQLEEQREQHGQQPEQTGGTA